MASGQSVPRIIICGTGYYGCLVAKIALEAGYEIVAAVNRAGPKVGQDLGMLAGLGIEIGVVIQDCEKVDYASLDADIGLVVQTNNLHTNLPMYRRLIGAGINVLCHGTESYYPKGNDPKLAAEIDALAKQHDVTFSGTGIWDMSRVWSGILLAGQCTHIRSIFHRSRTDFKGQATPEQAVEFGCGLTVDEYSKRGLNEGVFLRFYSSYTALVAMILDELGYTVIDAQTDVQPITLDRPLDDAFLGKTIPAGDVIGNRMVGSVKTSEGPTGKIDFECRLFEPEDEETMFWSIDGKPRAQVTTTRLDSDYTTAACLFNRIKDVIAAPPGNVLISQLGPTHSPELTSS